MLVVETNRRTGDEVSTSVTCSSCKERRINFTAAKAQKLNAFKMSQPTVSVPVLVTQALELALKQMNDVPATADHFPPMETFNLENLGAVAEAYDELCKIYEGIEEHEMAILSEFVGDLAVTASDANCSSADHWVAESAIHYLNLHLKITVPLTSCLCQIQLFNIEKKFGLLEESYQAIEESFQVLEESYQMLDNDDRKQHGEDVPAKLRLSFRQRWSSPLNLTEPMSNLDKKSKPGKKAKPVKDSNQGERSKPGVKTGKKLSSEIEALVELLPNCKLAIEAMQDLKETISNAEKPVELPSLPASFRCGEVPFPKKTPAHIRQRLLDREFAIQEFAALTGKALGLLCRVRNVFAAWCSVSHEAWYVHLEAIPFFAVLRSKALKNVSLSDVTLDFSSTYRIYAGSNHPTGNLARGTSMRCHFSESTSTPGSHCTLFFIRRLGKR